MTDKEKAEKEAKDKYPLSGIKPVDGVCGIAQKCFVDGYLSACSDKGKDIEELVSVLQSSLSVFEEAIKQSNNPNKPEDFKFYAKGIELLNKHK